MCESPAHYGCMHLASCALVKVKLARHRVLPQPCCASWKKRGANEKRLIRLTSLSHVMIRETQEGCGGLRGENPGALPKTGPIFQRPFSLPENAQTLPGIAFRAAGKSVNNFPAASKLAGKLFQQGIADSHSLLELSDMRAILSV